jgi:cytoskeletal protein CcmA (bactofilin family)
MGFFADLKDDLSQTAGAPVPEEQQGFDSDEPKLEEEAGAESDQMTLDFLNEDEVVGVDVHIDPPSTVDESAAYSVDSEEMLGSAAESDSTEMAETEESETDETKGEEEMSEESIYVASAEAEIMKTDLTVKKATDETAMITMGMKITGDIASEGSLELQGSVKGNINVLGKLNITGTIDGDSKAAEIYADNAKINGEGKSEGSVKIGQSTVVIGNILANSAVIAGAVKGDIDIQGPVILDTSAIVMGNIKSKSLQINNGAVIEGMCSQCYAEVNPTSFFGEIKKEKEKEKSK